MKDGRVFLYWVVIIKSHLRRSGRDMCILDSMFVLKGGHGMGSTWVGPNIDNPRVEKSSLFTV